MAAFNSVVVLMECPGCGHAETREVQFRYGQVYLHRYYVGSSLNWGQPAVGEKGTEQTTVPAWLGPCTKCGREGDLDLVIRSNRIVGVAQRIDDAGRDGPDAFAVA